MRITAGRLHLIGYLIMAAFMIGALFRSYEIDQEAARDRAAIERRFAATDAKHLGALRTVLCLARRNTLTSRQRTPAEKERITEFYNEALLSIDALPCDPLEDR